MLRFKIGSKWPRKVAFKGSTGRVRPGCWDDGTKDEAGNPVAHEVEGPYYYEVRMQTVKGTEYIPAGPNGTDAEAFRIRLAAKKSSKEEAVVAGWIVVDPVEVKDKRIRLADTAAAYIDDCHKRNALEAEQQARLVTAEFMAAVKLKFVDEVTRDSILTFDQSLRDMGRARRTIKNKRQRLQSWLRFAGADSALFPPKVRVPKTLPTIYDQAQIKALMGAADAYQHMAISMLLKLGLRDGEGQHAEWSDIDWLDHTFHVQSKAKYEFTVKDFEDRRIPIGDDLMAEFKEWRAAHPKNALIIPTRSGRPNGKLLAMLKGLVRKAGIGCGVCANCTHGVTGQSGCDEFYLHKFRATWITSLFRAGFDPVTIMAWAGHEDLETTLRYARPAASPTGIAAVSNIKWEG